MAFTRNTRGPKAGQGDHREEAKDAGEASPPKPGFGAEIHHPRIFGGKDKFKWTPEGGREYAKRPSLPTYGGRSTGNMRGSRGVSHPYMQRDARPMRSDLPGPVKQNRETEKR